MFEASFNNDPFRAMSREAFNSEFHARSAAAGGIAPVYKMRVNGYLLDGTDNERIRSFIHDPANYCRCDACPYDRGSDSAFACGQSCCGVAND